MKTIKTFTHDTNGQSARVLKNEDGEYVVRFFAGAEYLQDSDYFTDDKQDAFDTAEGYDHPAIIANGMAYCGHNLTHD